MSKYQTLIDALKAGPTDGPWVTKHRAGSDGMYRTEIYSEQHGGIATCEWTPKNCGNGVTATYRQANARLIAAANPATIRSLLADLERVEKALKQACDFIDEVRQDLHSRRIADWYPEGAHNAASAMSEDMRLLGNRCADFCAAFTTEPAQLPLLARSLSEWHEEDGTVIWWAWNGDERGWAGEAAYIGSPLCDDWPGYHTHWTPHPKQPAIDAALSQIAGGGDQA